MIFPELPPPSLNRTCPVCGTEFAAKSTLHRFDKEACRTKYNYVRYATTPIVFCRCRQTRPPDKPRCLACEVDMRVRRVLLREAKKAAAIKRRQAHLDAHAVLTRPLAVEE